MGGGVNKLEKMSGDSKHFSFFPEKNPKVHRKFIGIFLTPSQTLALKNFHYCRLGAERRV